MYVRDEGLGESEENTARVRAEELANQMKHVLYATAVRNRTYTG